MIDYNDKKTIVYISKKTGKKYRNYLYRKICDFCQEKICYATKSKKKQIHYCKKCQYQKLSRLFTNKIKCECKICGKDFFRSPSQYNRSSTKCCSYKCSSIARRKSITKVQRSCLKKKMLQAGVSPVCIKCNHNHIWNLQAHHKIRVKDGGSNNLENLQFLCRNCHGDAHCDINSDTYNYRK